MLNIPLGDILSLLSLCLPFAVSGAAYLFRKFESNLPANTRSAFDNVVSTVVTGIEQKGGSGYNKKAQAVTAITKIASDLGWKWVSPDMVDLAIEATVRAMNLNAPAAVAVPTPAV